jgi:hypothetical protein
MVKVLILVGSADHSLICDMMVIKKYMSGRNVERGREYLTVAKVKDEKHFHGYGVDRQVAYDTLAGMSDNGTKFPRRPSPQKLSQMF